MKKNNDLIVKANNINEGFIDMTKLQYKITLYAISKIDKSTKEFRKVCIHEKELREILSYKGEGLYEYLKGFEKELLTKSISLNSINGNRININWYSYTKYNNKEGFLELAFNHDLSPYLLEIDIPFTKYLLDNVKDLSSKHATRIYEILIQFAYRGKLNSSDKFVWSVKIELDNLRKMLGISEDQYKEYYDFKRSVILKAQKEFIKNPDTDIIFDFEAIKTGRSVTSIQFLAQYKKAQISTSSKILQSKIDAFINKFNDTYDANLGDTPRTKKLVADLMNSRGLEHFEECFKNFPKVINSELKQGNIRRVEGFFMNFAKHGYNFNTSMLGQVGAEVNFDQREYTEEDFEKYYYKVEENQ